MSRLSAARLRLVLIQLAGRGLTPKLASRIGRLAKTWKGQGGSPQVRPAAHITRHYLNGVTMTPHRRQETGPEQKEQP